jgi:hypothetical protein
MQATTTGSLVGKQEGIGGNCGAGVAPGIGLIPILSIRVRHGRVVDAAAQRASTLAST